jgi:hypothetical protein
VHAGFWYGNMRERDQVQDLGLCRRIIIEILKVYTGWPSLDCLVQNRYKWRAVVNMVMKFWVP